MKKLNFGNRGFFILPSAFFISIRACLKKKRGCVEDQPQHVASASTRREFKTCCG
jgi:hypothetical protein